jgi:phosphoribosyl 1,2-cyclic phosphodiesterase
LNGTNILIDPGPGTLVRCAKSKPRLNPSELDAIILTHKHLDHSADINIMIEAMTDGGFKKRGAVFCPEDALTDDPVILKYLRGVVERIEVLKEGGEYSMGDVAFNTPVRMKHGVETYGLNMNAGNLSISFIVDTRYFVGLESYFDGDIFVLNVARYKWMQGLDHLCVADAKKIIGSRKPKATIITHFGMTMLREKPWEVATRMQDELGVEIIAARDGMDLDLDRFTEGKST